MSGGRLRACWRATRPYSSSTTFVPILLGTSVAKVLHPRLEMHGGGFLIALLGAFAVCLLSHACDACSGEGETSGRFARVDPRGLAGGAGVIGFLVGLYFVVVVGTPIVALMLLGVILAMAYTLKPVALKHRVLGGAFVLLLCELGIAYGAYAIQARDLPGFLNRGSLLAVLAYALPVALPALGILHAKDHRDRADDRAHGVRTLASHLSAEASHRTLALLLASPFALLFATSLGMLTTPWVLLCLFSMPCAVGALAKARGGPSGVAPLSEIARFHGTFGLLTSLGVIVDVLRR